MTASVHYFPEARAAAERLAATLATSCQPIDVHTFPDGESLVRVEPSTPTAIVYRSLDHPNVKLMELLLAASALRQNGAGRVILVAPYLPYMRQDTAFRPGEAVSQKVIGRLMACHFDGLVTVDPHLHRTPTLGDVVPGVLVRAVSAARALADMIRADMVPDTILVGPDSESRPWVENIGALLGVEVLVGEKQRLGDRTVALTIPGVDRAKGRPVILIDDMISSGATLIACAEKLSAVGAGQIEAVATHYLAGQYEIDVLAQHGIERIRSADTIDGPTACAPIAPVIADVLREWIY